MKFKIFKHLSMTITMIFAISSYASSSNTTVETPCTGTSQMLNLVNRPTNVESACAVPDKDVMLEMGYQYQKLNTNGYANVLPFGQFRLGLPFQTEFTIIGPDYFHQTTSPANGVSVTSVGLKHVLASTKKWITTIELLVTPPSGSYAFGSHHTGAAFNGIMSYNISEKFNISGMLGASSQSDSISAGGKQFGSINPDVVFTWQPQDTLDLYAEIYGQTKSSAHNGTGFNFNTGVVYLLRKNMTIDAEIGRRLIGELYGFEYYLGVGLAVKI